jgi:tryptophan-rich sensory protein
LNCQFAAAIRKVVLFFVVGEYWWMLFAAFATLYFVLRSPVLGAVDTIAGLIVGLVSLACASRLDRAAAVLADATDAQRGSGGAGGIPAAVPAVR